MGVEALLGVRVEIASLAVPRPLPSSRVDMLTGLYGYIFGDSLKEDSTSPAECSTRKLRDEDWLLVDEEGVAASGRSSPVLVASPELVDLDSLSTGAVRVTQPPSPGAVRRAEALRQARAVTAHRARLEKELFEDSSSASPSPSPPSTTSKAKVTQLSAARLKRATAAGHVQAESKVKSRSKKAGRLAAGRNNDRKVNNLS